MLRRWEAEDPATRRLWRMMNEWVYAGFRVTYDRLGCRFDRWYFESETWQLGRREVERGLAAGVFYRKDDGSVWARLEPLGLQDKVLLRADGTTVYITQDIGTAILRFQDYGMDRLYYVVGAEQEVHFRNLFAILKLLGFEWADRCVHATYSMVTLPRGMGKLKSREGKAVDADDLLDELRLLARGKIVAGGYAETPETIETTAEEIGQGALKLYLLEVGSEKAICFDPEETISFTGDTGPAVQYSHARIHGIVRKGLADGRLTAEDFPGPRLNLASATQDGDGSRASFRFLREDRADPALLVEPEECQVVRLLAEFPDVVASAASQISPAPVAKALLDLTKAYARMYHQHEVLKARPDLMRARVQLALCVAQVLRNGLSLLTIDAPQRM
jgi:arginyl-tRNA synthetase